MRRCLALSPSCPLVKIRQLATLLVCLASCVRFVVGRGPDKIPVLSIWDSAKLDCSLFRNESVLRPLFHVWPEDAGVRFQYCCEYQPGTILPSGFELSNYTYYPGGGTLQPVPYYDLEVVETSSVRQGFYLLHWNFWGLPNKRFRPSVLFCDATDMQDLYFHRLLVAVGRGMGSSVIVVAVVVIILYVGKYYIARNMLARGPSSEDRVPLKKTDKEEAFSDLCHFVMLSIVGSFLMEGIAHSPIVGWRSQLMFNMAVTYSYLTLFAAFSVIIRHLLCPHLGHAVDWRWQKVFGQMAATGMLGAYLVLVEDVSGRSLDAVTGLVLATCTAASVWSGGVELVVIARALWREGIKKLYLCRGHCDDASDDVAPANQADSAAHSRESQENPTPALSQAVGAPLTSNHARDADSAVELTEVLDNRPTATNLNNSSKVLDPSSSRTNLLVPNSSRSGAGS